MALHCLSATVIPCYDTRMPLVRLDVPVDAAPLPENVAAFLAEADRRIERSSCQGVHAFVPSDYAMVYAVLEALETHAVAPGHALCEWGSGMGVVASLAAMLGFEACGIEINRDLVAEAEGLAEDFGLSVEFVCGNLIPTGAERFADTAGGEMAWLSMGGADAYEQIGLDIDDFDVIFAYPWPGEREVMNGLFAHYAAVGAVLVTYHGLEGVLVQRKVAEA